MVPELKIDPVVWDGDAARHLEVLPGIEANFHRGLVERREANVFGIFEDGKRVGTFMVRWCTEKVTGDQVAEIVALASTGSADATEAVLNYIQYQARRLGFQKMFFRTQRPGLIRKLAHLASETDVKMSWRL